MIDSSILHVKDFMASPAKGNKVVDTALIFSINVRPFKVMFHSFGNFIEAATQAKTGATKFFANPIMQSKVLNFMTFPVRPPAILAGFGKANKATKGSFIPFEVGGPPKFQLSTGKTWDHFTFLPDLHSQPTLA